MVASAGRCSTTLPTRCRIEICRGGLDTALPWVQFDVVQARDDGVSNPNHAMLTQGVFVNIITNREDAERQAEHGLTKKRRAKPFCFVCTTKKNHDKIPLQICKTQGLSLVLCSPPPRV